MQAYVLLKYVAKWSLVGVCIFLSTYLLGGCCTIDTRFSRHPSEVTSVFPSSHLVFTMLDNSSRVKATPVSDMGSASIIGFIFLAYPLIEIPPALLTDVLLWPLDSYYISQRSSKKSRASEELPKVILEKQQNEDQN